jgi:hypothetical protein
MSAICSRVEMLSMVRAPRSTWETQLTERSSSSPSLAWESRGGGDGARSTPPPGSFGRS